MIGIFSDILLEKYYTEGESLNLTNAFTYYHGEVDRKGFNPRSHSNWDEELYYKNIEDCIKSTLNNYYVKDKNEYILHVYTMGDEYSSVYLGSLNVRKFKDNKFDWEWNEQEDINSKMINYLRKEVQTEMEKSTYEKDDIDYLDESYTKRSNLKDSEFGLPDERKYPLDSKKHVLSAIKFFNYVDSDKEKELAKNINHAIDKFFDSGEKVDIHVGKDNRFSKYFNEGTIYEVNIQDNGESDYLDNGTSEFALKRYNSQVYSMARYVPSFTLPKYLNISKIEDAAYKVGEKEYKKFWKNKKGFQVKGDYPGKFFQLLDCSDESLQKIVDNHAKGTERLFTKLYQHNFKGKRQYSRYSILLVEVKSQLKGLYIISYKSSYKNNVLINVPINNSMYNQSIISDIQEAYQNENSHIYYNNDNIYEEDENMFTEGYIKNQPDIYYNKDKFDSGEINLCFITGHSGSGKSTMGRNMASNNIEHYELDDVVANDNFDKSNFKEYGDLIYSFFNGPGKKFYHPDFDNMDKNYNYEKDIIRAFVKYAISYAKSHKNKKYVLEGIWLFFLIEPDEIKDHAVYIKGTSALISKLRAAKRNAKNETNTKAKQVLYGIKYIIRNENYIYFEKYIKKYRDYFSKLTNEAETIKESAMINEFNIPDIPLLNSYNISGLAMDIILNELSGPDVNEDDNTNDDENFDVTDDDTETQEEPEEDANADSGEEENFDVPDDTEETPDNTDPEPQSDDVDDNGDDENFDMPDETEGGDDTGEENTGENNGEEGSEDAGEGGEENFDLPEDGDGDIDTSGSGDEGGITGDNSSSMDGGGLDQTKSKLQEIEDKIFDDLSETDKANKIGELKRLFMDLHSNCNSIIEMIDDIPKNENTLKIIDFINKSLEDTKRFILDYITNTFDSKSYMENMAEFQKYITVLYSIRDVLDELKNGESK